LNTGSTSTAQRKEEAVRRYDELTERCRAAKIEVDALKQQKREQAATKERLRQFITTLRREVVPRSDFDEQLWRTAVESVTVRDKSKYTVKWRSGTEIGVTVTK
jgi:hypothetical protein